MFNLKNLLNVNADVSEAKTFLTTAEAELNKLASLIERLSTLADQLEKQLPPSTPKSSV